MQQQQQRRVKFQRETEAVDTVTSRVRVAVPRPSGGSDLLLGVARPHEPLEARVEVARCVLNDAREEVGGADGDGHGGGQDAHDGVLLACH